MLGRRTAAAQHCRSAATLLVPFGRSVRLPLPPCLYIVYAPLSVRSVFRGKWMVEDDDDGEDTIGRASRDCTGICWWLPVAGVKVRRTTVGLN